MKIKTKVKNFFNSFVERAQYGGDNYCPYRHGCVLTLSMLFMWPYMLYMLIMWLTKFVTRDTIYKIEVLCRFLFCLVAPFFFWVAPVVAYCSYKQHKKRDVGKQNENDDF